MRFKLIACKTLAREFGALCAECGHFVDVTYLCPSCHKDPAQLRLQLQEEIHRIESGHDPYTCKDGSFDAILLGFGLCRGALCGLSAKRLPVIIPRVHNCAELLLGSRTKYRHICEEAPGPIFWYTPGLLEQEPKLLPVAQSSAAYVQLPYIDFSGSRCAAREAAAAYALPLTEYSGNDMFLRALLAGNWPEEEFLTLPPHCTCEPSYCSNILRVKPNHHSRSTFSFDI